MKLVFQGTNFADILDQMKGVIAAMPEGPIKAAVQAGMSDKGKKINSKDVPDKDVLASGTPSTAPAAPQGPGPKAQGPVALDEGAAVGNLGDIPVDKSGKTKKPRTAKQLENDERLRVAALAKIEAKRAAKIAGAGAAPAAPAEEEAEDPTTMDPADVIKLRQKTIEDLQAAYAGGHQKEVFELLARFGNGAKSFRELPADAFVPIRKAIDNGALT